MRKSILGLLLGISFSAVAATAQAVTWTAYTYGPSDSMAMVQSYKKMLDEVEKATDGDLKFRVRLGGSLPIQATNITQAVGNGTVQMADDGFFLGNVKVAGILRLPFLLQTPQEYAKAAEVLKPYIDKEFADQGVVVLGSYLYAHQSFYSGKKIINTDDVKGLKIRVSSPEQAEVIQRFGGVPVTMGTPEVAPALSSGAIDGALTASAGGGKLWRDMFTHNYRLPINYFDGLYIVNKAAYDKLKPETREALRKVVEDMSPKATAVLMSEESTLTKQFAETGMVVTEPTKEQIDSAVKALSPYWDTWAKNQGPVAEEALAKVRAALGR